MVLMNLLYKKFFDYVNTEKYPNQIIDIRKEDILDIEIIHLKNYDLSRVKLTSSIIDLSKIQLISKRFF